MIYSNAPWDEIDNEEVGFRCTVYENLYKSTIVATSSYEIEEDWEREDGESARHGYYDTQYVDWEREYKNDMTILDMLAELKKYVEKDLENTSHSKSKRRKLEELLQHCSGWQQESIEVIEE